MHSLPYPLTFEPILLSKVWGGDRLMHFGKKVKPREHVGESWEVADLDETSKGGAGGGAQRSVIANGALKGQTLHDALQHWGWDALVGSASGKSGGFPLLVKYLDARDNLSVQVHPSAEYAAKHPGAHVKTECWYVLDAAPRSMIYKGVKPGVTRDRFARTVREGKAVDDLVAVPAVVGECHFLPSGTVHALGAGVLVAEVQTPSDTTFRVDDWGRLGRELHIGPALECIAWSSAPSATKLVGGQESITHVKTDRFSLEEHVLKTGKRMDWARPGRAVVAMLIAGEGELHAEHLGATPIRMGTTILIPAATGSATFDPAMSGRVLLAIV